MLKQAKKPIQLQVQPWGHQQQTSHTLTNAQISIINPIQSIVYHNTVNVNDYIKDDKIFNDRQSRLSKTGNKNQIKNQNKQKDKSLRKLSKGFAKINYIKKNTENINFKEIDTNNLIAAQNYQALLNQDLQNFIPINANSKNSNLNNTTKSWLKRPTINTTYIGYYEDERFYRDINNNNEYKGKNMRQCLSMDGKKRPRTSDISKQYDNVRENVNRKQYKSIQYYDKVATHTNNNHLQKLLKLKEKLRQKIIKNISKNQTNKDNPHFKSASKINQDKRLSISPTVKNQSYSSCNPSRKNSFDVIQNPSDKKVDKWKQHMKMQENYKLDKKLRLQNCRNARNNGKFFGVIGGSIYK